MQVTLNFLKLSMSQKPSHVLWIVQFTDLSADIYICNSLNTDWDTVLKLVPVLPDHNLKIITWDIKRAYEMWTVLIIRSSM